MFVCHRFAIHSYIDSWVDAVMNHADMLNTSREMVFLFLHPHM